MQKSEEAPPAPFSGFCTPLLGRLETQTSCLRHFPADEHLLVAFDESRLGQALQTSWCAEICKYKLSKLGLSPPSRETHARSRPARPAHVLSSRQQFLVFLCATVSHGHQSMVTLLAARGKCQQTEVQSRKRKKVESGLSSQGDKDGTEGGCCCRCFCCCQIVATKDVSDKNGCSAKEALNVFYPIALFFRRKKKKKKIWPLKEELRQHR